MIDKDDLVVTLRDFSAVGIIGVTSLLARSGPERYLSDEEERLVKFLVSSARIGYAIVSAILARKQGLSDASSMPSVTKGWW